MSEVWLQRLGWKVAEKWAAHQMVWLEPVFIHDFGDRYHHMSLMWSVERDEEGEYILGPGLPSNARFVIHELLDDYVFYPIRDWLSNWVGDNEVYSFIRSVLGFFWGFNCGFPSRDVALYLAWDLRGCRRPCLTMERFRLLEKKFG